MRIFLIPLVSLGLFSCSGEQNPKIMDGDFLFLTATDSELSQAIDQVTADSGQTHFTHMGLAQVMNDTVWVWHSAPGKGVVRELLDSFRRDGQSRLREMHLYRLPDSMARFQPVIWKRAGILLGKPYNYTYIMEDSGYYCSEFVFALYSNFGLFKLEPMNFRDPQTGNLPSAWVEHYQQLGIPVPEGRPGCNPNGMSRNPSLQKIGILR